MRYYDQEKDQLVYIEQAATPAFWDTQWEDAALKKSVLAGAKERFVYPLTRRYLKPGSKILEGGFGKGHFVYSLHTRGYDVYGVDYAEKTVAKVSALFPELKLSLGDVRHLDFPDNTFDGYWSVGVIEHFPEGYTPIAQEMFRVLKPGGYLFLTFPYMSPLRKLKARLGMYPLFEKENFDREHFYQFALNSKTVTEAFKQYGFTLVREKPYSGFKGLKDESGPLKPFFQRIYDNKSLLAKLISYSLTLLFAPVAAHTTVLILRKK